MSRRLQKDLRRILISAVCFAAGILVPHPVVSLVLLAAAYLIAGYDVLKEAAEGVIHGQLFDENFLMAIATVGAVIIGEYHEAAAVMLFYQVGEWFQKYAVGKSRTSISALMDIRPDTAEVERNGEVLTVDPEEVAVGETLIIRAGERIPLDGIVLEGTSSLDTAALTGESLPRDVAPGDEVISGCINQTGLLKIRAEKEYADSTVARILDLVENASDKKAHVESFITRFARVYTPAVCAAALLLFLIPPLFFGGSWADWGYRALSFLVVSCPCALVISVPLSFFSGIGAASRSGILVKGSNYLEALARVDTVVFDKTGTLTHGRFTVSGLYPEGCAKEELLKTAAVLESNSTHPISRSICALYAPSGEEKQELQGVQEIAGKGLTGLFRGASVAAGNESLMETLGIPVPEHQHTGTAVHVARDGSYLGCIIIEDEIKQGAAEAIQRLTECGIRKTVMLTGDTAAAAKHVSGQLGISEVHAQLLPHQKVERVETLLEAQKPSSMLAFVGDGINDAPVLTRADVGIAMGALGSDAAVEAADVVLMDDDPRKIVQAVRISRKTLQIVRQNIVFALGVKLAVLALVAAGAAGMWLAVFADVGVSVLAILNAMRALKTR